MYLRFKHNAWRHVFTFWLLFFCWTRLSRSKCSYIVKANNSLRGKAKSRTSHRKIRKVERWKVKRLHCQFREVEKSKSGTVSFWISKSKSILLDFLLFDFLKFVGCLSSWTCAALFSSLGKWRVCVMKCRTAQTPSRKCCAQWFDISITPHVLAPEIVETLLFYLQLRFLHQRTSSNRKTTFTYRSFEWASVRQWRSAAFKECTCTHVWCYATERSVALHILDAQNCWQRSSHGSPCTNCASHRRCFGMSRVQGQLRRNTSIQVNHQKNECSNGKGTVVAGTQSLDGT
jgi:hypothetical protein